MPDGGLPAAVQHVAATTNDLANYFRSQKTRAERLRRLQRETIDKQYAQVQRPVGKITPTGLGFRTEIPYPQGGESWYGRPWGWNKDLDKLPSSGSSGNLRPATTGPGGASMQRLKASQSSGALLQGAAEEGRDRMMNARRTATGFFLTADGDGIRSSHAARRISAARMPRPDVQEDDTSQTLLFQGLDDFEQWMEDSGDCVDRLAVESLREWRKETQPPSPELSLGNERPSPWRPNAEMPDDKVNHLSRIMHVLGPRYKTVPKDVIHEQLERGADNWTLKRTQELLDLLQTPGTRLPNQDSSDIGPRRSLLSKMSGKI
eukprot:gnl/MRDRNA2_/MRDRNA2_168535_c0_seq1.p1 gnl/MRDRNA2_/MRDRNA2_168535_c0~~gnl/MRDRNA2_/MRDRNA2_168535_c0_seq1.p1  ORF type:complete len:319 (-),score=53.61 gnl/MRDRNA2_/MRDRNA2_168535_c0_seq1:8-964(-)